jgi:putative tricarboxylic transport membrane protein
LKLVHQVTCVLFILLAAFVANESMKLRFYTPLGPGPGFFPFWISIVIGLLAGVKLLQVTRSAMDPIPADFFPSRAGYLRIIAIIVAVAGTVLLMEPLGFRLTMLVFFLLLLAALGRVNPIITAVVMVAGSFGVYYLFDTLLHIALPVGMFGI